MVRSLAPPGIVDGLGPGVCFEHDLIGWLNSAANSQQRERYGDPSNPSHDSLYEPRWSAGCMATPRIFRVGVVSVVEMVVAKVDVSAGHWTRRGPDGRSGSADEC